MAFGSLRVLKSRDYALLWFSGSISSVGTWMQTVAVGALVTSLTHKAAWGGLVAATSYLTSGIFTPIGGVIADRHNRRLLLLWVSVGEAVVASALAAVYLTGHISPWVLEVNVALEGLLLGLYMPASQAMLPDLVGRENLADAAALGNASYNLGRTVGPAIGGAVIVFGSYGAVFIINAASFLVVALAVFFVRLRHVPQEVAGSAWERLREGFEGARSEPGCWSAIKTIAVAAVLVSPFIALIPAMAQLVLKGDVVDTSHLVIAQGVGSVIGAFALAPLAGRFGRHRMIVVSLIAMPLAEMAYSQSPNQTAAIFGAFVIGVVYVGILVGLSVITQLRAPAKLRARILSLQFTTLSLFYPLGAALQGWIGDHIGVRTVQFYGPGLFLIVLVGLAVLRPGWLNALDDPPEEEPVATESQSLGVPSEA